MSKQRRDDRPAHRPQDDESLTLDKETLKDLDAPDAGADDAVRGGVAPTLPGPRTLTCNIACSVVK